MIKEVVMEHPEPPQTNRTFWRRIGESLRIYEREHVLTKVYDQLNYYTGEVPEVTFLTCIDYFERTPQLQHPVYGYVDLITGTNLQINTDDEKAKRILEEWNKSNYFYNKLRSIVTTMFICGVSLVEKGNKLSFIEPIDMRIIVGKNRTETGELKEYKYKTQTSEIKTLDSSNYIEFNLSDYSKTAWGRSLFYSLIVPRTMSNGQVTKPMIEVLWSMEDSMDGIMKNHAAPITFITYPNATQDFINKKTIELKKRKPGSWFLGDRKPEVDIYEVNAATKYERMIEHIEKTFQLGTQFPMDIMTGDFTSRASSQTTESLLDKRVRGFQHYIIQKIMTEIYEPILMANGINPMDANISLAFETSNLISIELTNMIDLYAEKVISVVELREWLKDRTGIDLFDDAEIQKQIALGQVNDTRQQIDQQNKDSELDILKKDVLQQQKTAYETVVREIDEKKVRRIKRIKETKEKTEAEMDIIKKKKQVLEKMDKKLEDEK